MVFYSLAPPKHMMIDRFLRLLHTVRYLRLRQVAYQVKYRLTGQLTKTGARTPVPGPVGAQEELAEQSPVTFQFLQRAVTFSSPRTIDWNYAAYGKLWTYNLNYFEFLQTVPPARGLALIQSWITAEPTHRDGWEPYPTSLRLVSWLHFFQTTDAMITQKVRGSIQRQYVALWSKLEYHLGGNHLLENAIALCLTAHFLADQQGAKRAQQLLRAELDEQYLEDGGHYELSPMYHAILLDRLLTLWHGLTTSPAPAAAPDFSDLLPVLRRQLTRQLGWLAAFATPDGRYAHFNDSTYGIAPPVPELLARGRQLGITVAPQALTTSGYRRWEHPRYDLWLDVAAIGPAYIPGHAHADNLTFVLHAHGVPLIVDPAISTYEKNARRAWERSTAAHNTVTVGGQNSSDVWGGFRVGKRAVTRVLAEETDLLRAAFSGPYYHHERTFFRENDCLLIQDRVKARTSAVARFHFDYRQEVRLEGTSVVVGPVTLSWSAAAAAVQEYEQAVGWNDCRPARCLELTFIETLEVRCRFSATA